MCTAITLQSKQGDTFFGRNMDFSYEIHPHLYVIPRNYQWKNALNAKRMKDKYGFIGIGQEAEGLLGFFDGVNEMGFAAAALYFAGYASYSTELQEPDKESLASFEFLHYMLGQCSSIKDIKRVTEYTTIYGTEDPVTNTAAPLHWIAVDRTGECVVVEQTEEGLYIRNNPIGVLTNSPDLPWHLTNLRNYMEATPWQTQEVSWGDINLSPFGQAGGTSVLPGGYTSPERFVRTSYLKSHIPVPEDKPDAIVSCFHVMESVTIPKGAVITNRNEFDYTKYTAFIDTSNCQYYFKTYDNIQVATAGLYETELNQAKRMDLGPL